MNKDRAMNLEAEMIREDEFRNLGHRVVYDILTGYSINISGVWCDPKSLDENGFKIRFSKPPKNFWPNN